MAKKIGIVVVVVLAVVAIWKFDRIKALFSDPVARTINTVETKLLFGEDPSYDSLLMVLKEKGVIEDIQKVKAIAREENIDTTRFAGGKYVILSGTRISDLLKAFVKNGEGHGEGEVMVNVIFNNCRDINDVAGNISRCIAADSASLADYILDPATLSKYGFTAQQMPALFLPKQYEMPYDTDAEGFVAFMAGKFREFWNEERKVKMRAIGLSAPSKVVTLASIVYSEQGKVKEEWPIIAKLYLNRLEKNMPLQSDPTFKFCWGHELDNVQRLTHKHRDIDCEYNTYKINGLPPGPICITPASVIDAVLSPANVDYIFMCAKPDYSGEHNFTASGSVHARNASVYQKWLSKELKKNK